MYVHLRNCSPVCPNRRPAVRVVVIIVHCVHLDFSPGREYFFQLPFETPGADRRIVRAVAVGVVQQLELLQIHQVCQALVVVALLQVLPPVGQVEDAEGGREQLQAVDVKVGVLQTKVLKSRARLEKGLKGQEQ